MTKPERGEGVEWNGLDVLFLTGMPLGHGHSDFQSWNPQQQQYGGSVEERMRTLGRPTKT